MSTLYIRLPSKAAADQSPHWIALPCPFAQAQGETITREGLLPLADLADAVGKAQRVVLLLAASDVTLLRAQVPPLSPARLKIALPNLLEDQLMSDPEESVFVAGPLNQGLRTVAVANRGWMDILWRTFSTYGARQLVAVPSQLCLPFESGVVTAAASCVDHDVDLAIRLAAEEGIGLPIFPQTAEQEAGDVVQTLAAIVPSAPITLYVAQGKVPAYQEAVALQLPLEQRITVYADNWSRWLGGAARASIDVLSGLGGGSGSAELNWRPWRWPLALLGLVLLVNIIGLNLEYWRKQREAETLRTLMVQTYKLAYPRETVIVDPVAQMRQKIVIAQRQSGQPASDDFVVLAANFGAAWDAVSGGKPAATTVAGIDYRERSLFVKIKPGVQLPVEPLRGALAERRLTLTQTSNNLWQIRSAK